MPFRVESSDVLVDEFDELVSDVNAASVSFVDFSDIVMSAGIVLGDFVSDLVRVDAVFAQFSRSVEESIRFDGVVGDLQESRESVVGNRSSRESEFPPTRESGIGDVLELEGATQGLLRALESVAEVSREDISVQVAVEGAALMRLDNQERAESEHASKLQDIAVELRQLEIAFEQEKTQITRESVLERTELNERAESEHVSRLQDIAVELRQLEVESEQEKTRVTREEVEKRTELTERAVDVVPGAAFEQARDFMALTDGIEESIGRLETGLYDFSEIFSREFTNSLQSGMSVLEDFQQSFRAPRLAVLTEEVRESDVISRLESGQSDRDERTAERFAAGASRFRSAEVIEDRRALSFFDGLSPDVQRAIDSYREERAIELGTDIPEQLSQVRTASDRLSVGAGDLVASVPFDVVDAVTDIVEIRRDANAELVILEEEAAAEIQLVQESVTLSAENKAKAIERIERETALRRIRIENEVSERQRASFQSVVTNFLSGVGQMIAAEAQLALARRATDALSGVFGGGGAVAAAGSGLFSSVLLPLLGGLTVAYGATKLIAPSSPSADVYERLQYGVSGEGSDRSVVETPGLTRASQETDTPILEANISVNVEASGTRLGQANARERLKTERWGG